MSMIPDTITLTKEAETFLEDLAAELEIPQGRYEQARERYRSLGEWLHRDASTVRQFDPQIYAQGSFRLGTAIKPPSEKEDYDVDSICLFKKLDRQTITQQDLKIRLGQEVEAYRTANSMIKPLVEGRRCWVLSYADGAQFHMDMVPAVPSAESQRRRLLEAHLSTAWAETAVSITDNETPGYMVITDDWQRSNPKGYSRWFKQRTTVILEKRQALTADRVRAEVEAIPTFKLKLPLQAAVMILKRHRDNMFSKDATDAPISVIITSLAAHAYNGEARIGAALVSILAGMDRFILTGANGEAVIQNPSDPLENFADKWVKHPERKSAFYSWLATAREDFSALAGMTDRRQITERASDSVGEPLAKRAEGRRPYATPSLLTTGFIRDEAQARREAVRIQGDNRSA
ncbi:nucleotidyltransferase domain-containing protein [Lichenihabitans psoromatis]|uniref:nucleotidyltransferase domain-containing protein n=1 Tax=Lichenihabitans psoromatis TaxID=2528642 RepID=UPI001FDF9E2A|nr:nucleotidyltransferase [Lichenihabitans psoromatis]